MCTCVVWEINVCVRACYCIIVIFMLVYGYACAYVCSVWICTCARVVCVCACVRACVWWSGGSKVTSNKI